MKFSLESHKKETTDICSHRFHPFSKFPPVKRDITVIVPELIIYAQVVDLIFSPFLIPNGIEEAVKSLSIFRSEEKIGVGKKSLSFRLSFVSYDRTLTKEEVDTEVQKIKERLREIINAKVD